MRTGKRRSKNEVFLQVGVQVDHPGPIYNAVVISYMLQGDLTQADSHPWHIMMFTITDGTRISSGRDREANDPGRT